MHLAVELVFHPTRTHRPDVRRLSTMHSPPNLEVVLEGTVSQPTQTGYVIDLQSSG